MMGTFDDIACSADIGRINPEEPEPIEKTHACPKVTNNYKPLKHKTVSLEQCLTRLQEKNRCTKNCPFIKEILAKKK